MSLLLLSARPSTAANHRLAEEAAALGVDFTVADATQVVTLGGGSRGLWWRQQDLLEPRPAAVLARVGNWRPDAVLSALEVAVAAGVPTLNPPSAVRAARDHWATVELLGRQGLPVPTSLVGADPEVLADAAVSHLGLPVVVKSRRSRMGVGVILCHQRDHLEAVLDSLWRVGEELLVQRYLSGGARSFRLLVVGGEVVAAASFVAGAGEWRSNAARGGTRTDYRPTDDEIELAVTASASLGLGLAGVDLVWSEDRPWVCEVNPTPGFSALESASGVNVARHIVTAAVTG